MRILTLALTFVPTLALAASTSFFGPVVPPCTEAEGAVRICQACNLVQLGDNILRLFVALGVVAAALMFAYAGFLYVTAAANKANLDSARKIFTNTLIGLIFILAAYLVVDLVIRMATNQSLNIFTSVECISMQHNTGGFTYPRVPGNNPVSGTQGTTQGVPGNFCSDSQLPGFQSMIGDAIDKKGSTLTNGTMTGVEEYCPNYASMSPAQRKVFWQRYMSGVAQYESRCNPNANPFPETTMGNDTVTGLPVVSEGLFQLSYGSERGRAAAAGDGTCYFDPATQDIRDPTKNTQCAIFILNADASGRPKQCVDNNWSQFQCATRYWSVSRSRKAELIGITQNVPGCR